MKIHTGQVTAGRMYNTQSQVFWTLQTTDYRLLYSVVEMLTDVNMNRSFSFLGLGDMKVEVVDLIISGIDFIDNF